MGQAPPIPPEGGSSFRDGFGSAVDGGATRPAGRVLSHAARDSLSCRRGCFCTCSQRDAGRHVTVMSVTDSGNDGRVSSTALTSAASFPRSGHKTWLNSMHVLCCLSQLSIRSSSLNTNVIAGSGSPHPHKTTIKYMLTRFLFLNFGLFRLPRCPFSLCDQTRRT